MLFPILFEYFSRSCSSSFTNNPMCYVHKWRCIIESNSVHFCQLINDTSRILLKFPKRANDCTVYSTRIQIERNKRQTPFPLFLLPPSKFSTFPRATPRGGFFEINLSNYIVSQCDQRTTIVPRRGVVPFVAGSAKSMGTLKPWRSTFMRQ